MASKLLQCATVSLATLSGFNYTTCYKKPSDPAKPHILFVHGFPSSSYDWRHQVLYFADAGYGIIAPDLLGYGDTDKPDGPEFYTVKKVSEAVNEVVSHVTSNDTKVIGVGHDWGSIVLSRLANYHPERFLSYAFVAVGYYPHGPSDIDATNALHMATLNRTKLGYQKFFNESDSGPIIDSHQDSFIDLIYPENMTSTWLAHMGPLNATRKWLESDTRGPRALYVTDEEFETHKKIFSPQNHGYQRALNSYRAIIRGLNVADESTITGANNRTDLPTLYIGVTTDPLVNVTGQNKNINDWSSKPTIEELPAGHWPQLEKPDDVNRMLKAFFQGQSKQNHTGIPGQDIPSTWEREGERAPRSAPATKRWERKRGLEPGSSPGTKRWEREGEREPDSLPGTKRWEREGEREPGSLPGTKRWESEGEREPGSLPGTKRWEREGEREPGSLPGTKIWEREGEREPDSLPGTKRWEREGEREPGSLPDTKRWEREGERDPDSLPGTKRWEREGEREPGSLPGTKRWEREGEREPDSLPGTKRWEREGEREPGSMPGTKRWEREGEREPGSLPGTKRWEREGEREPDSLPGTKRWEREGEREPGILPGTKRWEREGEREPGSLPGTKRWEREGEREPGSAPGTKQ